MQVKIEFLPNSSARNHYEPNEDINCPGVIEEDKLTKLGASKRLSIAKVNKVWVGNAIEHATIDASNCSSL